MAVEAPVNGVGTTLAAPITAASATCLLTSATGFTNAQYRVLITDGVNYEIGTATALSGTTLSITRATEAYGGVQTAHAFPNPALTTVQVVTSVASVRAMIAGAVALVYDVRNYGTVDPTGVVDSTAAILATIAAAAANPQGGIVWIGPGLFKISSPLVVNSNTVSIVTAGNSATILEPTAALNGGVVLTVQMSPFQSGVNYFSAGTFSGFTIDGANTTSATGLQYGDVVGGRVDISVNNFRGASGLGVNFVNTTNWTEENFIRLYVNLNTVGAKFGLTGSGTNSFGYNDIDIFMRAGGGLYSGQIGIQISTAIQIYNSKFRVRGNISNSATGILGVASGTTYGGLSATVVDIAFETNDSSACVPLSFPGYFQFSGSGHVDTTGGNTANSSITTSSAFFTGYWDVPGAVPGHGAYYKGSNFVVAGGTVNASSDTSATATASAPTFVSGTALQLNATSDTMLYIEVTTGSTLAVAIGPTSTPATTLISSITAPLGLSAIRVPKGWYVTITGTIADLNITAVSC